MKPSLYPSVALLLILTSCSAPRYTYYFDQQHYPPRNEKTVEKVDNLLLPPNYQILTMATSGEIEIIPVHTMELQNESKITVLKIPAPGWNEKVEVAGKGNLQKRVSGLRATAAPMEKDLKRSIIFGASGIVALILGGSFLWVLGSLSLLIGLIFLIKWTMRR